MGSLPAEHARSPHLCTLLVSAQGSMLCLNPCWGCSITCATWLHRHSAAVLAEPRPATCAP